VTAPMARRAVELVWNKGIAALCDRRIPDEFPNGRDYSPVSVLAGALSSSRLPDNLIPNPVAVRDIQDGELVWVRLSWLKSFIHQVLPFLQAKFVLVTGDSDSCVPSELKSEARAILDSPKVIHWFTQNYDSSLAPERISPIPIGIDLHLLAEKASWGEDSVSPAQQEEVLRSVCESLPPVSSRIPKVYVDFAWQRGFGLRNYRRYHPLKGTKFHDSRRRIARTMIRNPAVFCQPCSLPRTQMWRERGQYAFVLSPHGMGLDCHRTWEALALGHIVLVPSSSLDALFAGLPVVPLQSWTDITPENLTEWLCRNSERAGMAEKLTSRYWTQQMRAKFDPEARLAAISFKSR